MFFCLTSSFLLQDDQYRARGTDGGYDNDEYRMSMGEYSSKYTLKFDTNVM